MSSSTLSVFASATITATPPASVRRSSMTSAPAAAFGFALRAWASSPRSSSASRARAWSSAYASPDVTASIRRTPEPTEPSERIANGPISAVVRTWQPPHSSRENASSPAPHLDHADDVAVLLAEERHRAQALRLVDRRQERMDRQVLEDALVHDLLDPGALLGAQRLGMAEVEAQLVGPHGRAGLADVVAEHLLERLVEQVRRGVVRGRREADLPRHDGAHAVARGEP